MKNLSQYLLEAINESMTAFEGDIVELKKNVVIYTSGDYDMFGEYGKTDIYDELDKQLGKGGNIILPKGSIIQFGAHNDWYRNINIYTKKVNFTGLIINRDQEEEILAISKEIGNDELQVFTDKYNAKTIEANMI